MALKQCKECGNTVSNQAKTCPHCGARVKKSSWGLVCIIILVVGLFLVLPNIIIPKFIGRQVGGFFGVDNAHVKNPVEDVKLVTKSHLEEEYGNECVSLDLGKRAENDFAGEARLADGRELFVTAKIEGELINFTSQVKAGYEYKCKHHIDSIKLSAVHDPSGEAREGAWCLSGKIWNDDPEPIRGFVIAEIVDKSGRVSQRVKGIVPFPRTTIFRGDGVSVFEWIPPGKSGEFKCLSGEPITEEIANIRVEFVNLGDEPLASIDYDSFEKSMLDIISVKITANAHPAQKEILTVREWFEQVTGN